MPHALTIDRRRIALSNLDKVLYPSGFTKHQVIDYYLRVAPAMLPHLAGRAVTLKRYPDGADKPHFYEKRCPSHRPEWVRTAGIHSRRNEGLVDYCLLDDLPSLVWAANLAAIELHLPLARAERPDRPDFMVFDLDPGPGRSILDCARLALRMRDVLEQLGLDCLAKTSGGKGLHLYIPLNTPVTFEQTKQFSRALAMVFERENAADITTTMTRSRRAGRVFIDWSQNDQHKTTAAVYSLRAGRAPGVSTPVEWDELEALTSSSRKSRAKPRMYMRDSGMPDDETPSHPLAFSPEAVLDRIDRRGDLFAPLLTTRQRLPDLDLP